MNPTLEDFEVWVGAPLAGAGGASVFPTRVIMSPAGPASGELGLDLDAAAFEQALSLVRSEDSALEARRAFGNTLFQRLFTGEVKSVWDQSLGFVTAGSAVGLRLRLWIDVPRVARLPWELLWDDGQKAFLATAANMAVSRYLPVPEPALLAAHPRLRVLVVVESPPGPPPVKEEEVKRLTTAIGKAGNITDAPVVLRNPTARQIQDALQQNYNVLHYLGHGQAGKLVLTGEDGALAGISDAELAMMFRGRRTLRLVVLSACHSSQTDDGGLFSGIAPSLVQARIPAVVAMQYPTVQLETAGRFNEAFYGALANGIAVDAAVNEARQAIAAGPLLEGRDWSTPVLYMGTRTGRLFNFESAEKTAVERDWKAVEAALGQSAQTRAALANLVQRFEQVATAQRQVKALIDLTRQLDDMRLAFQACERIVDRARGSGQKLAPHIPELKVAWGNFTQIPLQKLRVFLAAHLDIVTGGWLPELDAAAQIIEAYLAKLALKPLADGAFGTYAAKLTGAEASVRNEVDGALADLVTLSDRTLGTIVSS